MTVALWLYSTLLLSFYLTADGFNLPLKSDADSEGLAGTFQRLMDTMRSAATLSLLERLQHLPKGKEVHQIRGRSKRPIM